MSTLRPVANSASFIACVLAAGEVQDRRIAREQTVIKGREVEHPGFSQMTSEDHAAAGRKGGEVRKTSPERGHVTPESGKRLRGFAAMSPERRREVAALGGASIPAEKRAFSRNRELASTAGREGGLAGVGPRKRTGKPKASAMKAFGLTAEEFSDYGIIRAKGFTQTEAVDIILRSRKPVGGAA